MIRRTVSLPESVDALVREFARESGSYSAAVARLVEEGGRALRSGKKPRFVGAAAGPGDLGLLAEEYLRDPVTDE